MQMMEHAIRPSSEHVRIAGLIDPESSYRYVVDCFGARLVFVAPGNVVPGARGQHVDVGVLRQMLGDVTGVQLCAAVDVGAIALHDDSELHCAEGSGSSPEPSSKSPSGPSSNAASPVGSPC